MRGRHIFTGMRLPIKTYRPRELLTLPEDSIGSQALIQGVCVADFI